MSQENVEIVQRWWDGFNTTGMPPLSLCDERIEIRNLLAFRFEAPSTVTKGCATGVIKYSM